MENIHQLVRDNLQQAKVMQLATVATDGKPWICTVSFVSIGAKIYWLSFPTRRHSQEVYDNPEVAIAVVVKSDMPVIGMQFTGHAHKVTDIDEITQVMAEYIPKHHIGEGFVESYKKGSNKHEVYVCELSTAQLFDEVHFPGGVPQVVDVTQLR